MGLPRRPWEGQFAAHIALKIVDMTHTGTRFPQELSKAVGVDASTLTRLNKGGRTHDTGVFIVIKMHEGLSLSKAKEEAAKIFNLSEETIHKDYYRWKRNFYDKLTEHHKPSDALMALLKESLSK